VAWSYDVKEVATLTEQSSD